MTILDLTSGGQATYVLGPEHPALLAARAKPDPTAAARLRDRLEQASGLQLLSFHATADEARTRAIAVARQQTGRNGVVACRGTTVEPGSRLVSHGDGLQLEAALTKDQPAAFVVEVVQIQGGVRVPPPDYFDRVRASCVKNGVWLVANETTGFGRTGTLFAFTKEEVVPELMVASLALLPGVTGGALLARRELGLTAASIDAADPVAATVALAALEILERDGLVDQARRNGKVLQKAIHGILETRRTWSLDTRGRGLVHALTLWENPDRVIVRAHELGLSIDQIGSNVLLFTPPLLASAEELQQTLSVLDEILAEA